MEEVTIEDTLPSCAVEGQAPDARDVPALPRTPVAAHGVLIVRLLQGP
jgi:hypothetical protein